MKHLLLLTLAACLLACSPHKRLARLIAKHPELVRTDTVVVRDTVRIPGDTLVKWRPVYLTVTDTVTVENERQVVRWVRVPTGSPCDTARIEARVFAAVKADTVFTEVRIPCDTVQPVREVPVVPWWVWAIVGVLAVLTLIQTVRR